MSKRFPEKLIKRGDDMKKKSFSQILYLTKRAHPFFESRMGAITNQIGLTPQEGTCNEWRPSLDNL